MDADNQIKEIEVTVKELERLMNYLYTPINRLRNLRNQISGSIDLLSRVQKGVKRASKKNYDLTLDLATQMGTTDKKILDKSFGAVTGELERTKREVQERWEALKEAEADKKKAGPGA